MGRILESYLGISSGELLVIIFENISCGVYHFIEYCKLVKNFTNRYSSFYIL